MLGPFFADIFDNTVQSRGVSLGQLAGWLSEHGCPIHRGTLGRRRDGDNLPDVSHLPVLQLLPDALGLTGAEADAFLRDISATLGFRVPRAQLGQTPAAPTFPHRLHFGADHLPPFAGRAAELVELQRLVLARRSVFITGQGGIGKTRLAQELLRTCAGDFAHGCELLTVTDDQDAAQVIRNVAGLLGIDLRPEELAAGNRRLALDRLNRRLQGVSLLFLVDNVSGAGQVRDLAQGVRAITWIITSRRASLKRIGVHPLHLRPPGTIEAAAIFRAHLPAAPIPDRDDDQLVARVADKVDALPFALRLAAAVLANNLVTTVAELDEWLTAGGLGRAGSPAKKLERLFDSMLATLPPTAHRTLLLCGAFPTATVRLSTAQAVGEAAGARPTLADWAALEDYSLVEFPDHTHVALHARLHEHVGKRLSVDPACAVVRAAFAAHYLALAESVTLGVAETERDYRPLIGEEPNLLAAAATLHDLGNWSGVRRLWPSVSGCLWVAGDRRGYEAFDRLCLTAARVMGDEAWVARLLSEIGYVALEDGDWAAAETLFSESQVHYDAAEEVLGRARLRRYRAQAALSRGDSEEALALLAEAERLLADAPDGDVTLARMLLYSARMSVHHRRGEWIAAEADGRATHYFYRRLGAVAAAQGYAGFHVELGDILYRLGQTGEASGLWAAFLASCEPLPHLPEHAEAQVRLAWLAAQHGEQAAAAELAWAARVTLERHGQLARGEWAGGLLAAIETAAQLPEFDALFGISS